MAYGPFNTGTEKTSGKIDTTEKGAPNGVATLGGDGKVPGGQLPVTCSDIDIGEGAELKTGSLYFVYESEEEA